MNYNRIDSALAFATEAHKDQKRRYTGEPYVDHCVCVAIEVSNIIEDEEVIMAALLHDTLEDTDTTHDQLVERFGERVANIVLDLTDVYTKQYFPELNRVERKKREANRLAAVCAEAKLIKTYDLMQNAIEIEQYDPKFAPVYFKERIDILRAMGNFQHELKGLHGKIQSNALWSGKIKNDLQYKVTRNKVKSLQDGLEQLTECPENVDPIIFQAMRDGVQSLIDKLQADIRAYEEAEQGINP